MQFQAEHVQLHVNERVQIQRPPELTEFYKQLGQIAALVTLGPLGLILLTCILHIPILPVIGLVFLLWLVRCLEEPLTRLTTRLLWPPHRLYLQYCAATPLTEQVVRDVKIKRRPTALSVDPERGHMVVGDHRWDLIRGHAVELERASDQGAQLRIRLFQSGRSPLVVGADVPVPVRAALGRDFEELPRKEGEVLLMPWGDFHRFVKAIAHIHEVCGLRLPRHLKALLKVQGPRVDVSGEPSSTSKAPRAHAPSTSQPSTREDPHSATALEVEAAPQPATARQPR